jgi:molybdate transport system regulatory protein
MAYPKASLRIEFGPEQRIGPGKVRLLELVAETGSISAAAREMDMSYRRAWLLVDEMNRMFKEPVIAAVTGGARGGGAQLTELGQNVIATYRAIEADSANILAKRLGKVLRSISMARSKR